MQHRELYREIVPDDAYIITYTDLANARTENSVSRIANEIYYKMGNDFSNDAMKRGTEAHKIKELELDNNWDNEVRLSYNMGDNYYLCGTIDRYYSSTKVIEDYKCTGVQADNYLKTKQIETYAFLAMNNDRLVNVGRYTTIDLKGNILTQSSIGITEHTITTCYKDFILPKFNLIKDKIKELANTTPGNKDMKDKSFTMRLSAKTSDIIKEKSKSCGIGKSKFIRIAVELVKEDDVTQYVLDEINNKQKKLL